MNNTLNFVLNHPCVINGAQDLNCLMDMAQKDLVGQLKTSGTFLIIGIVASTILMVLYHNLLYKFLPNKNFYLIGNPHNPEHRFEFLYHLSNTQNFVMFMWILIVLF